MLHGTKASIVPDSIVDTWNLKQLTMGQVTKVVRPSVPRCPTSFRKKPFFFVQVEICEDVQV